jgi:hypothetical protein
VPAVVVTVSVEVSVVLAFGKVRFVGLMLVVTVGSDGETDAVSSAVPTKRVLAPLPFMTVTVEMLVVATPADTLADDGDGVTEAKVLAADARRGIATTAEKIRNNWTWRRMVFMFC